MSLKYSSAQFSEILVAAKTIRADLDRGGVTTGELEEKYARIKGEYPMFFKVNSTNSSLSCLCYVFPD